MITTRQELEAEGAYILEQEGWLIGRRSTANGEPVSAASNNSSASLNVFSISALVLLINPPIKENPGADQHHSRAFNPNGTINYR
jgi:hypothetical protein